MGNIARIRRLAIGRVPPAITGVVVLAHVLDITPSDASYLWVARNMGLPLVTLDERLRRAAERG